MSSVFLFPSLKYIYAIYMLPICINLRHNILKILVKNFLYKKYIPQVGAKIIYSLIEDCFSFAITLQQKTQRSEKIKVKNQKIVWWNLLYRLFNVDLDLNILLRANTGFSYKNETM